jgi:hypothetical protein
MKTNFKHLVQKTWLRMVLIFLKKQIMSENDDICHDEMILYERHLGP